MRVCMFACVCVFACLVGGGGCVHARLSARAGQCHSPQCSCDGDVGKTVAGPCVSFNVAKGPWGSTLAAHVALNQRHQGGASL